MSEQTLMDLLVACQPEQITLIGQPVFRLQQAIRACAQSNSGAARAEVRIDQFATLEAYQRKAKVDNFNPIHGAMCLDLPDSAANPALILGQGCRLSPRLLLVEHSQRTAGAQLLADAQFFAFGFRLVEKTRDASGLRHHRYAYSLRDYKRPPDWLNARFWAHPERFDLQD